MPKRIPGYRFHKARDCAVVTINGRNFYLGAFDSPESWEKYHRLIAEWLSIQNQPSVTAETAKSTITVNELILAYWQHAKSYYVKEGKPTSEQAALRQALGFLRRLYGSTSAQEFGPKALKAVRQAMIEHKITVQTKKKNPATGQKEQQVLVLRHGLTRKLINKQIQRIRRVFAWAVEEEMLPVTVHQSLLRVKGIRKGQTTAREKPRIRCVADAHVEAILPQVPAVIRTMIEVHRLCGGRPQDIVQMRGADIDRSGPIWEYAPGRYKTEHLNQRDDPDRDRVLFLGPRAQELLKPYLTLQPTEYLFSPQRSESERSLQRRQHRKTPLWPSHVRALQKRRPKRQSRPHRDRYDVASYRRAIRRACLKAGVAVWHPNQLRHSCLTLIRKRFGLEASKACAVKWTPKTGQSIKLQLAVRGKG